MGRIPEPHKQQPNGREAVARANVPADDQILSVCGKRRCAGVLCGGRISAQSLAAGTDSRMGVQSGAGAILRGSAVRCAPARLAQTGAHRAGTLSVLSATAELLGDNLAPEKQAHYLGVIQQQAQRMDGSVRQMLELSRLETGAKALRRTAFSLAELAQERLQAALPTDSTIHTEFAAQGEYEVNADRALLTRALDALLENAVQHTPEGGCITVHLADGVLSVTNTGDAIPADALPRLWEAYYQADPSRSAKGDGLGLSIAKTVFDLHGFTCGAENTEIGPKFWFQFADK